MQRDKFARRLILAGQKVNTLVEGYEALATLIEPMPVTPVIHDDPEDDHVLACAHAAQADYIVSGDQHLLGLGQYGAIPIVRPADLIARLDRS